MATETLLNDGVVDTVFPKIRRLLKLYIVVTNFEANLDIMLTNFDRYIKAHTQYNNYLRNDINPNNSSRMYLTSLSLENNSFLIIKDCVRYIFASLFYISETRKNIFYFTSKAPFVLEIIKF